MTYTSYHVFWDSQSEASVVDVSSKANGSRVVMRRGDKELELDLSVSNGGLHVRRPGGEILRVDVHRNGDGYELGLGGRTYRLSVQEERDTWLKMGGGSGAQDGSVSVSMPGRVVKLNVGTGDAVVQGQTLLIVEAMKMENEVKAPCDGVVRSVNVEAGTSVEAGQVLVEVDKAEDSNG